MTLNDLKTEVAALGFEPDTEDDSVLISAANRALAMIFSELPSKSKVDIPCNFISPCAEYEKIEHKKGEKLIIKLSGTAYSFKVSGSGSYTVVDGDGIITKSFDTPLSRFSGFLSGGKGEIIFTGDNFYTIFELLCFDSVYGNLISDIPDKASSYRVKIDDFADNFFAFCEKPRDSHGSLIAGATVSGRNVIFPRGFSGLASIEYIRKPQKIDTGTVEIDIDNGISFLLPLLTAYFVWIDDEPERSEKYLSIYRASLYEVKKKNISRDAVYTDVTGWA